MNSNLPTPQITLAQAWESMRQALVSLPGYPTNQNSDFQRVIFAAIERCTGPNPGEIQWLAEQAFARLERWTGVAGLRKIYCELRDPADGIEPNYTEHELKRVEEARTKARIAAQIAEERERNKRHDAEREVKRWLNGRNICLVEGAYVQATPIPNTDRHSFAVMTRTEADALRASMPDHIRAATPSLTEHEANSQTAQAAIDDLAR